MAATLFSKIIEGEMDADIVHEDEYCIAFRDINPQAPMHILLIPRKPVETLAAAELEDQMLLGHLMLVAGDIARGEGYGDAFRLVVNNGEGAQQTIFHLHLHIIGGRPFDWPPG